MKIYFQFFLKIQKKLKLLRTCFFISEEEKKFILLTSSLNEKMFLENDSNKILVQGILDYSFLVKQFFLSHYFAKKNRSKIDLILLGTSFLYPGLSIRGYKKTLLKRIIEKKIINLYSGFFFDSILSFSNINPILEAQIEKESQETFLKIKTKEDLLQIKIQDTHVGDLIYDTYLRFAKMPEVKVEDPFLLEILKSSFQIYHSVQEYLEKNNPILLLTSYSSYIYHGILVRILLERGVSVYSFGLRDQFLRKISKDFPFCVKDYTNYRKEFESLTDKEAKLEIAKERFLKRFSGEVDSATFYMKKSSFAGTILRDLPSKLNGKKVALIMLHCFFDSPHIYRNMLFPDFMDWFSFIMEESKKVKDVEFVVKPHPNGLPENNEIVESLKTKYPDTIFIEKSVSNHALINEINTKAVFTVYGTVAHEFPYFGIPVINAGDNPHINYSFCFNPQDLNEFRKLIHRVSDLKINDMERCRREILEFYYMHNIHLTKGKLEKNDIFGIDNLNAHDSGSRVLKTFLEKNSGDWEIKEILKQINRADLSINQPF